MRITQERIAQLQARYKAREEQEQDLKIFNHRWSKANPQNTSDLSWLVEELNGQDVHIIGGGVTLFGIDWSKFEGRKTIIVNNTLKWMKKGTCLLFLDMPVLEVVGQIDHDLPVITKIGNRVNGHPNVHYIKLANRVTPNPLQRGFYSHYATVHVAISIALFCSAKRIFLWGCEQMMMNQEQFETLKTWQETSNWYKDDILRAYHQLKHQNKHFGHFYSTEFQHGRDNFPKPYQNAGNGMKEFLGKGEIYNMSPIHNTPFAFFDHRNL